MLFFVLIGTALGLALYFLGMRYVAKKPEKAKKAAKIGGVLAIFIFLLRLGPLAVFNLVNLFVLLLPFANKDSFFRRNYYNDSQNARAMTKEEARQILGLGDNVTSAEIKSAFNHLMKKNHPDVGGSKYLAEQIIQARDLLLKED